MKERFWIWLAWHLPRRLVYWSYIRVQTYACLGSPVDRPATEAMQAWQVPPDQLRARGVI